MAKKIIDLSGLGGLCPRYFGDYPYSSDNRKERYLGAENQYAYGICNPLARLGQLSPANKTFADIVDNQDAIIGSVAVNTDNSRPYFFERGAKLYEIANLTSVGGALSLLRNLQGTAIGTDLEFYTINGVRKLFYAYKDSYGHGQIGIYDYATVTFDDTWASGTATTGSAFLIASDIKLVVADNGFMYALNGSSIDKINGDTSGGPNGTLTANVFIFPAFFKLIDAIDLKGYLWIASMRTMRDISTGTNDKTFSEYCGVGVWDRRDYSDFKDFIPINGIKEIRCMFNLNNTPGCFTISNKGYTQIRLYNGNEFALEYELGQSAFPRFSDSVVVDGDLIKWLGYDGIFYAYGIPYKGATKSLYMLGDVSYSKTESSTFISGGAILMAGGSPSMGEGNALPEAYYLSFQDSIYKKLKRWYPNSTVIAGESQFANADNFIFSMVNLLPKLSTVNDITLFYPKKNLNPATSDTDNLYVNFYFNMAVAGWGTTTLKRTSDGNRGYRFIPVNEPNVNSIQFSFNWSSSVTTETSIKPMFAEINYTENTKKK